jgi:hypothetical protein
MNYIIQNKINIKNLQIISLSLFLFIFILPKITFADNLYGQACGNTKCSQDEVCQKQYRGVLPIETQGSSGNATYTCVKPQKLEAPDSPYKGVQTACGDLFETAFGLDLSKFTGDSLVKTLGDGLNKLSSGLGSAFKLDISGPVNLDLNQELNWKIDPTNLIATDPSYFEEFIPQCDSAYNNIKGIINTNYLVAPLPVDIFNPLPLPVNVTSPTPLPVVVVDDLALYQQKELVDAPLAAQQKAATIATVSDTFRSQIALGNLIPNNLFALEQLGIQFGALDPETGVLPQAVDKYGSYANSPNSILNGDLAKNFIDLQDPLKSKLPAETFSSKCGNIKVEEATTLECQLLGLQTNNNANDIKSNVALEAIYNSNLATGLLKQEVVDIGDGYFSQTLDDNKNPFIKEIQTPGSNIASLSEKVNEATIDQAIIASGDNCFEAIPKNIIDGTLKPILVQGLYGVNNTLASVINNTASDPVNALRNNQNIGSQLQSTITGAIPDPNQLLKSLQNSLVRNITGGLSCQLNKNISTLLNGILGDISIPQLELLNIPGVGSITTPGVNVTDTITNTVNNSVNDTLNNAANNLIR